MENKLKLFGVVAPAIALIASVIHNIAIYGLNADFILMYRFEDYLGKAVYLLPLPAITFVLMITIDWAIKNKRYHIVKNHEYDTRSYIFEYIKSARGIALIAVIIILLIALPAAVRPISLLIIGLSVSYFAVDFYSKFSKSENVDWVGYLGMLIAVIMTQSLMISELKIEEMRKFEEEGCRHAACFSDKMIVDRVSDGFILFDGDKLHFYNMAGEALVSQDHTVRRAAPLVCRVGGVCEWFGELPNLMPWNGPAREGAEAHDLPPD